MMTRRRGRRERSCLATATARPDNPRAPLSTAGACMTSRPRVVVFDLDGTITRYDTLVPFLFRVLRRRPSRWLRLWPLPWALGRYALTRDRGILKESLIRYALGGLSRREIDAHVAEFLDWLWPRALREGALAAIERHRSEGAHLVLLSASPDLYVPAIGARLRFDDVICTLVQWDGELLHGYLASPNRHGPEKRRCVQELRARHPGAEFAAYGNAASDLDHFEVVEAPCLVNADRFARRLARARAIPCDDWP